MENVFVIVVSAFYAVPLFVRWADTTCYNTNMSSVWLQIVRRYVPFWRSH